MPRKKTDDPTYIEPVIEMPVEIPRPRIEVLERGLQNVFGLPSEDIKLKDPDLVTRWLDCSIRESKLAEAEQAGYLRARPEYLQNKDHVSFTVSPDGYVARGPRGQELLIYTTRENANRRERKKAEVNRGMMNPGATKAAVLEAASQKYGEEAAEYLNAHSGPVGSVRDQYERIERSGQEE
jgi:hypothetical protein